MVKILFICLLLMAAFQSPASAEKIEGQEVAEVEWDALMPKDYVLEGILDEEELGALDDLDPKAADLMDKLQEALASAPVVPEMAGKMIKIPGFVVPVEGEGQKVYSFFLVPYFGACIHVPPPPSNQIIYVSYEPGVNLSSLYDAVWITGKIRIETTNHELATSGYAMEAFRIAPYE